MERNFQGVIHKIDAVAFGKARVLIVLRSFNKYLNLSQNNFDPSKTTETRII